MNGCSRAGSGLAANALSVETDRDKVIPATGALNLTLTILPLCVIVRSRGAQSTSNTLLPFLVPVNKLLKFPVVIVWVT